MIALSITPIADAAARYLVTITRRWHAFCVHTDLELNQEAYDALLAPKHLAIVPGAAHGFEEPGAWQDVAYLAAQWFRRYLDIEGL